MKWIFLVIVWAGGLVLLLGLLMGWWNIKGISANPSRTTINDANFPDLTIAKISCAWITLVTEANDIEEAAQALRTSYNSNPPDICDWVDIEVSLGDETREISFEELFRLMGFNEHCQK